ncbi:hypothetical protein OXPF_26090 [Oxobacter pfennigii]|uniref:Uncharacterized protein n=1 Tax=Oxobacter pfennigii TaxID=36849 RepID=A0A0P8YVN0_9CLOT|nr:hypothetical protein [Oxobacter pfennigii]KPU43749.1 hypothetical protein OXPF_26090 [Oxobacter pfennigii]
MRAKKAITLLVTVIIIVGIPSTVFYARNKNKLAYENKTYKSEDHNQRAIKVEEKLNDAYEDIIKTHKIDDSQYTPFIYTSSTCDDFVNGKYEAFSAGEKLNAIAVLVDDVAMKAPAGSTVPTILVSKDMDDVMVCYKDSDRTNVVYKAVKNDNNWDITMATAKGKPKMKIDK